MIEKKPTGIALDMMEEMLPHMYAIMHDEDFCALKSRIQKEGAKMTLSDVMGDAFIIIAKKNRPALYGIVSAVTGKTAEEIDAQPIDETLSVFRGAMGSQIIDFFPFCVRLAVKL